MFTGPYGHPGGDPAAALDRLKATSKAARTAGDYYRRGGPGLGVNAGHDLTLENLPAVTRAIPDIAECSIGHGVTADALRYGMAETTRRYVAALAVREPRTVCIPAATNRRQPDGGGQDYPL
jgi:pyridoxine 5-phosphate synthase